MSDRRPDAEITDPGYRGGGVTDGPEKFKPPTPRKPKPDVDYAETLLEAIDTTVTTRIQQAHLDKTVLCTILESDWTNVDKGEYYVSEGDAKYVAMGEPNAYRTNDRVWVLIPLGDYNNQKTIISRQVGDVGDSFVYISPLENFVRLTEDLVPNTNKGEYGLKTNDTNKYSIKIASIDMTKSGAVDIGGFSAFGISAKFKTDVAGLEIMRGNYGLHVVIQSIKEEIVGTTNGGQKKEHSPIEDNLYLQCTDMWGNPYGYDMFFEQSKMFEINDPGKTKIKSIDVYFFQTYNDKDATVTDSIKAIQSGKFVDINQLDVVVPEKNNLFVKDVSIYFGHTVDNLNTNAYLYSQNSPNFIIKDGITDATLNDKTLVAKFIYTDNTGKHYVLNSLGNNSVYKQLTDSGVLPDTLKVRWYIYNPLSTKNDLRAGSGWEDITDVLTGTTTNRCVRVDKYGTYTKVTRENTAYTDTQRTFRLNDADAGYEKFKVAFILFDSDLDGKTAPTDEDLAKARAILNSTDGATPDPEQVSGAQQTVDNYNAFQKEVRYWSQEVVFANGDDQTWGSLDALNSLRLEFNDGGYNGNYLIYNAAASGQAKMLNSGDAHVKRKLEGYFKSYLTGETDLTRNVIRWYIPKTNTMISEPDWKDEIFSGYSFDVSSQTYTQRRLAITWTSLNGKIARYNNDGTWSLNSAGNRPSTDIDTQAVWDSYYIFESNINTENTTGLQDLQDGKITIQYRVKEYWNQHFTNNKIMCKIIRDGKVYEKSVDLVFGAHGVNGTEYSLILQLGDEYETGRHLVEENVPAWTRSHPYTNYIVLKAQLYDERNQPLTTATYSWEVKNFKSALTDSNLFNVTNENDLNEYRLFIKNGSTRAANSITAEMWNGAYLTCTASYGGRTYTQDLIVPVRSSENYIGCVGATQAIYTYANTAPIVSSKDSYQILTSTYQLLKPNRTTCVYDSTTGLPAPAETPVKNTTKWYSDLPYLSNIKSADTDNKSKNLATLVLPPTYYQDMNYKMVVRMTNTDNVVSWIQPILIKLDVFTNSFLNQWDGSLQIDTQHNRIASASVFAGKKNNDNSFTGVIMGELQGETANANEIGYGIYGRNNGNHTFGINTNGTAYLGDSSKAQLLFRVGEDIGSNSGWQSTIQNYGYAADSHGMRLDFIGTTTRAGKTATFTYPYIDIVSPGVTNNKLNRATISAHPDHLLELEANGNSLMKVSNDDYYLQTAGYTEGSKGTKIDLKDGSFKAFNGGKNGALLISSTGYVLNTDDDDKKFKVNGNDPGGSGWVLYSHGKFGVDTTGKLFATGGDFAGKIVSTEGEIGGWKISSTSLYTGDISYNSNVAAPSGTVRLSTTSFSRKIGSHNGSSIWRFTIGSNFGVTEDGTLYANNGNFTGNITGSSISGGSINGSSISGGTISGGAISGSSISGGSISGTTISGSTIHAGTLYVDGSPVSYGSLGSFVTGVSGFYCNSGRDQGGRTTSVSVGFHLTRRTIYAFGARSSETTDDMTGDTAMIYHGSGESSTPDPGTQ